MRTTLDIDDAVLAAARALATQEKVSVGTALSRLAQRGLVCGGEVRTVKGFPTFTAGADATTVVEGDLDGDGRLDLAVSNKARGRENSTCRWPVA